MAHTTFSVSHLRDADVKVRETDSPRLALQKLRDFVNGLSAGSYQGTTFSVSSNYAQGTVTLSNVYGVAATGTLTYSSASGTTTATINGVAFQQTTGTDSARATALAAAVTASTDPLISGVLTASANAGVVTITAVHRGTTGNAITLAVTGTGLARSGATLASGANAETIVNLGDFSISTDTTDLSNSAAATAVAASINADPDASLFVVASASAAVVTIDALAAGTVGNQIPLSSVSDTGSATASGNYLTGGSQWDYTL